MPVGEPRRSQRHAASRDAESCHSRRPSASSPAVLLPDGGISAVGQGTGAAIAQACHIVLVSAEVLALGLGLEAAMLMIDDLEAEGVLWWFEVLGLETLMSTLHLPYYFIVLHAGSSQQASLQLPAQSGGTAMKPAVGALEAAALSVSTTDRTTPW